MCIRYAWDLHHQYLREAGLDRGIRGWLAKWFFKRLRIWDQRTADGVDHFIATSHFIRRRIQRIYRRDAHVIYPAVNVERFTPGGTRESFYLSASRMVPYKRIGLIVEAFAGMPERRLVVVGDGPEFKKVRARATPNAELLGYCGSEELRNLMRRARAFVFAAEEDFRIAPVETQACSAPVIAYGRGGATETILGLDAARPTSVFFSEQNVASIASAVEQFERNAHRIAAEACRKNALRFSTTSFRAECVSFVERAWMEFCGESGAAGPPATLARSGAVARGIDSRAGAG